MKSNHTPEMTLALKKAGGEKRLKSILIEMDLKAQNLTKKDVGTWRAAWQLAINPENPQRYRLYQVYSDIEIDLHLSGCMDQRQGMVLQKAFKLVDKNSKENPELTETFEAGWFKSFMRAVLDSRYWGHSLIQFGDVVTAGDKQYFDEVQVVPRAHVIPEFGVIVREQGDEPKKGIDYRSGKLAEWCIEAGAKNDLGLFLKCAPSALSKKNMLAYWDGFGELFGSPMRIATTTSRDNQESAKIEKMLANMGAQSWGLLPEGTTVDFKETSRGDAFNVYDRRIDRANSEISKGILNQTMTIDSGSSLSQSEVHLEIFRNVVAEDADFVRDIINNKLLPFMSMHGFKVDGYRFNWDESVDTTPEQQYAVEQMLLNRFEIDPQYFVEKYNIPIIKARETASFFE